MKLVKQKNSHLLLLIPAVALTMRLADPGTADASFLVLAAYALFGRVHAIQALFLSWVFTSLNEGLAPEVSLSMGRYAIMAGASMSVLLRVRLLRGMYPLYRPGILTLVLGLFIAVHSLFFSQVKDVSILKSVSWTLGMGTLLVAWAGLDLDARDRLEKQLFTWLIAILLSSIPFLFMDAGYFRDGKGFQGILSHPQGFGITMALLGAWLGARFIAERKLPWWQVGILPICLILIVLSRARTAGGALLLGALLPLVFVLLVKHNSPLSILPGLGKRRIPIAVIVASAVMLLAGYSVTEQLGGYLNKRSEASSVLEAVDLSRGEMFHSMIENIEEHPLSGIGFGIASTPFMMVVEQHPFLNLPTSAPIEKAAMPVAVMEELGIFGFLLVGAWMWMLLQRAGRAGFVCLVVFTTALLINLGEFVFFSPGGVGLLLLVLVAWAVTQRADIRPVAKQKAYRERTKPNQQDHMRKRCFSC